MKNQRIYFNLFLIILIGSVIRFSSLDKPEGLWNDEYVSWFISNQPLWADFVQAIFKNCHMPFYYIYLKLWAFLFGNADISLRISSVVPGILSIITMFFVGKEAKDEKTGLLAAGFTAVSGFLIYFSQEVRFYSILFLFSALSVLFTIRLLKNQNYMNFAGFYIFNLMIMFTHTIGFVFVFFNFLYLFSLLKHRKLITYKQINIMVGATVLAMIPFLPFLYKTLTASYISQFWSDFSVTKLFFVFADYVSPIQINLVNTPINISTLLLKGGNINWGYIIFAVVPLLVAFAGIISAILKKDEKLNLLGLIALSTLIIMIIASSMGKLVLITKYTAEIYPVFILIAAYGLYCIKPDNLRRFMLLMFFGLLMLYTFVSDYAPQKIKRPEGHKLVANLIEDAKLKPHDRILLLYYDSDRFGKYVPLDKYSIESITKYNFQYRLIHEPPSHVKVIKNGKDIFFPEFKKGENIFFENYLKDSFFNNMQKGDKFALVSLNSVAFIDDERMKTVMADEKFLDRMPFLFLIFSHISNITKKHANYFLTPVFEEKQGKWEISVWEKT